MELLRRYLLRQWVGRIETSRLRVQPGDAIVVRCPQHYMDMNEARMLGARLLELFPRHPVIFLGPETAIESLGREHLQLAVELAKPSRLSHETEI